MSWQKLCLVFSLALVLIACGKPPTDTEIKLPDVVVKTSALAAYKGSFRFVGRLEAKESVDIAAKVEGFIVSRQFKEGTWVDEGAPLFIIDRKPFEAELAKADAQLQSAKVQNRTAGRDYKRSQSLVKSGTISQSDFDRAEGKYLDTKANVAMADAQVSAAQLNLDYSEITAPISGRVGSKAVDVGDLVSPSSGALTTIKSIDPIQVNFSVDESTFLLANRQRIKAEETGRKTADMQVFLELSDGSTYPEPGVISFVDNHINEQTGTIFVRADIPNKDGILVPGQYVKAIVRSQEHRDIVAVPQSALMKDQQGDYLYTVNDKHTVKRKNVVLGDREGTHVFILSGLDAGKNVVIKGLQRIRPELQVNITTADAEPATPVKPDTKDSQ
ncbi:MAG: efflux RND transporter periplasmic adaptor subunit [Sinobacterium sp.]|nr:efflux RND transporter periplasmic adaptor subunit [Sinobacterium sp.]